MLLLLKSHTDPCTLRVKDFKTPLSPMDGSFRQKLNREMLELTDFIDQMDLTDAYRTFYPNTKEYTFVFGLHGAFLQTDHILSHKACPNIYKKIEIKFQHPDHHRL